MAKWGQVGIRAFCFFVIILVSMARPLRVEYQGALYHVISRGNAKQNIFLTDKDRSDFLDWVKDVTVTHNVICYAYCLMNNHYHLLLETPDGNLSTAMRDLNGNYTQAFNARHRRVGHLLQGRYKAFVIEKETYLLEVARYIVLNPVRSGFVKYPSRWRWSSYRSTAGITKKVDGPNVSSILSFFSKEKKKAQEVYRKFVLDGLSASDPYDGVTNGFLLGSPQFVFDIWEKTKGSEENKEHPRHERVVGRLSLQEIFSDFKTLRERDTAILLARFRCGYLTTEIAKHLGVSRTIVGKISRGKYNVKRRR